MITARINHPHIKEPTRVMIEMVSKFYDPPRFLVKTTDGSTPFVTEKARTDPEEQPYGLARVAWAWVPAHQLDEIELDGIRQVRFGRN